MTYKAKSISVYTRWKLLNSLPNPTDCKKCKYDDKSNASKCGILSERVKSRQCAFYKEKGDVTAWDTKRNSQSRKPRQKSAKTADTSAKPQTS